MTIAAAGTALLALSVGLAAAVPLFWGGGYRPDSRGAFVVLAGLALLLAVLRNQRATLAAASSAPIAALGAIAALTSLSAAWTVVPPVEAWRWGLVVAGYTALAIASAVLAGERNGFRFLAGAIAVLAALSGLVGLGASAAHTEPWALWLGGSWRPAGPFEYPPALALLEVSALPILLVGMARGRPGLSAAAAAAAAVAGCVLALADSRLELALAVAVLAIAAIAPARVTGTDRRLGLAAAALIALAGLGAHLVAGGPAPPGDSPGSGVRLLGMLAIVVIAGFAWPVLRASLARRSIPRPLLVGTVAILLVAGGLIAVQTLVAAGSGPEPVSGITHGRIGQWQAGLETAAERPLTGSGAESFLRASRSHQEGTPVRYAHNLPIEAAAELGALGLALILSLYIAAGRLIWRAHRVPGGWLLWPAAAAFLIANLFDWPWHLAGAGAIWALALGGLVAVAAASRPRPNAGSDPAPNL